MRDYLFDARTGYFVVDKPTGWEWGPAELDPAVFTLVRTEKLLLPGGESIAPADGEVPNCRCLQLRHIKLEKALSHSGKDNVFAEAALATCPERERILPSRFINLTNGKEYGSEDEMWESVEPGDKVVMQGWGDTSDRPLWALRIVSTKDKQADYQKVGSIEEAEQWLS